MQAVEAIKNRFFQSPQKTLKEIPQFQRVQIERVEGVQRQQFEQLALEQLETDQFTAQEYFSFIEAMIHLIGGERVSEGVTLSYTLRDTEANIDIDLTQTINADCRWSVIKTQPLWPGKTREENDEVFARYEWPYITEDVAYLYYAVTPHRKNGGLICEGSFEAVLPPLLLPSTNEDFFHQAYTTGEEVAIPLSDAQINGDLHPNDHIMQELCRKVFGVYERVRDSGGFD